MGLCLFSCLLAAATAGKAALARHLPTGSALRQSRQVRARDVTLVSTVSPRPWAAGGGSRLESCVVCFPGTRPAASPAFCTSPPQTSGCDLLQDVCSANPRGHVDRTLFPCPALYWPQLISVSRDPKARPVALGLQIFPCGHLHFFLGPEVPESRDVRLDKSRPAEHPGWV